MRGKVSSSKMAMSSSMALVETLLKLVNGVSSLVDDVKCHKKSCWSLIRRIKLLGPIFEEILEVKSPLPPAAVVVFQDMRATFQQAKQLIEDCCSGSRLLSIIRRDVMAQRFEELNESLSKQLDKMPLDLMAISDEIQEQTQLVRAQLKRAKPFEDAQEEQLHEDLLAVIRSEKQGMIDLGLMDPIIGKLGLNTLPAVVGEINALEEEKQKVQDNGERDTEEINRAMLMMKKLKISLGGNPEEQHSGPAKENVEEDLNAKVESQDANPSEKKSHPVPPEDFRCPISLEIMRDPVIVSTGQTYDRSYIEQWLKDGHKTCPKTQQVLAQPIVLIPNYSLRSLIQQWCETHGVELPKKQSRSTHREKSGQEGSTTTTSAERAVILGLRDKLLAESLDEKITAAGELRMLAKKSPANRICIAEAGIIPHLVLLLSSEDQKLQEHAVTTLLNLSIHDANKTDIVAARAIYPIVEILKSGSMEARENAAAALFSLSVIDENKIAIGQAGAIPALVELLKSGSARGKKDAATALFNLTIYQGNKSRAVRAGIVTPLIDLLVDRRAGMTDEALAILAVLSSSPDGRNAIGETDAVAILVDLMSTGSPRNKENAASVLLSLCINGLNHTQAAISCDVSTPLQALLRNGTPRAKRKASQFLQHLQEFELMQAGSDI